MSIGRGPYRSPGRRPIRGLDPLHDGEEVGRLERRWLPFTARFRKRGWSVTWTGSVS